jgi:hypothetical protein
MTGIFASLTVTALQWVYMSFELILTNPRQIINSLYKLISNGCNLEASNSITNVLNCNSMKHEIHLHNIHKFSSYCSGETTHSSLQDQLVNTIYRSVIAVQFVNLMKHNISMGKMRSSLMLHQVLFGLSYNL